MIPDVPAAEGWLTRLEPADLGGRLELRVEGGRIGLFTGAEQLRRSRRQARVAGIVATGLGLVLLPFSLWSATLVVAGLALLFVVPRLLRQSKLLEIDGGAGRLILTRHDAGAGRELPIERIASIRGQYTTQGWAGFSRIVAVLPDGQEVPIAVLDGTDEQLAATTCRTLGRLLERPASYAGPFGSMQAWPVPPPSP
jgi:hypothetical protein